MRRPGRVLSLVSVRSFFLLPEFFQALQAAYDLLLRGSCLQEVHSVTEQAPDDEGTHPTHYGETEEQVMAGGTTVPCADEHHCDPPDSEAHGECQY